MLSFLVLALALSVQPAELEALVAGYLWSEDEAIRAKAAAALRGRPPAELAEIRELERILSRGRPDLPEFPGERSLHLLSVTLPDGREMPVFVLVPPRYDPGKSWPMLLAMHGGPTSSAAQAVEGAKRMLSVWLDPASEAGWILVAPAMTHVVARAPRTEERLPYEILRPDQMEATLAAINARYHVDPNRVVSTGISLGSNFSIGYAASRPDRFAAIVPVSTEGDSRELLLRNLMHTPAYVLEGARDRNIRSIDGPRALAAILESFEYDVVYQEHGERAHEGFQELYPQVLDWLEARRRDPFPSEVLRVPHDGIMPIGRRVHWIEPDTRQGLVHAVADREANRIEIEVRWAREVRVYLHDALVDLDRDVRIGVNGTTAFEGRVERSLLFALDQVRSRGDRARPYSASVAVPVRGDAPALSRRLAPKRRPGPLSFWEMYARRDLEDRFPSVGLEGRRDGAGIRITSIAAGGPFASAGLRVGDVLLEVDREPFVDGRGLEELRQWLLRELDGQPRLYPLVVSRDGKELTLHTHLSLTPIPAR